MPRRRITNFGLPSEIAEVAKHIMDELPGLGFASPTDVVKTALRDYYLRLVDRQVLGPTVFLEDFLKRSRESAPQKSKAITKEVVPQ